MWSQLFVQISVYRIARTAVHLFAGFSLNDNARLAEHRETVEAVKHAHAQKTHAHTLKSPPSLPSKPYNFGLMFVGLFA